MVVATEQSALMPASSSPGSLRAEAALDAEVIIKIRRRAALDGCKWDLQVGDVTTLAPFPLVIDRVLWNQLAAKAERLAAEAVAAEMEIVKRPDLFRLLGLPKRLQDLLAEDVELTPTAGRVIRFDYHLTTDGWKISEANSDVPGGFTEASHFTQLIAEHYPNLQPAGYPAEQWSHELAMAAGAKGEIGLLSAPGYMEDHQVIAFLAAHLQVHGCRTHLAKPEQLSWQDGVAHLNTRWHRGPLDVIVRFYQAEWLSRLPVETGWKRLFRDGRTRVANPLLAVISESKRFPLVWKCLSTSLETWRASLPETRDPRDAPWTKDDDWLVKTAFCNTGDTVSVRQWMRPEDWWQTRMNVHLFPGKWVAQRRFNSVPIPTPIGMRHVCIGIYTVNGRACGAYARLSENPIINFEAVDVALLLEGK